MYFCHIVIALFLITPQSAIASKISVMLASGTAQKNTTRSVSSRTNATRIAALATGYVVKNVLNIFFMRSEHLVGVPSRAKQMFWQSQRVG